MLLVLLLLAAPNELQPIEDAYAEAEFEQVAALAPKQATAALNSAKKKRLYELAAFAEFFLGHDKQSAHYFELMFQAEPQASVDERKYPPKAVAFYRQQRDKRPVVGLQQPTLHQPAQEAAPTFAPVSLIPFGIGHLLLGDTPAGVVFMALPAALIATSIALYWVRRGERLPGDFYPNKARADTLQITQDVAAFAAIAVTLYGVIDAALFAQDRVAARRATVAVVPYGAGLALGIQY